MLSKSQSTDDIIDVQQSNVALSTIYAIYDTVDQFTRSSKSNNKIPSNINSIEKIDKLDNNFELAETPSTNTGFSFACVGQLPEEAFKGTFANPLSGLETNPSLDEDIIIEGNDNNKSNDLTVEISSQLNSLQLKIDSTRLKQEHDELAINSEKIITKLQTEIFSLRGELIEYRSKTDYLHSVNTLSNNQLTAAIAAKSILEASVESLKAELSNFKDDKKNLESSLLDSQNRNNDLAKDMKEFLSVQAHSALVESKLADSEKSNEDLRVQLAGNQNQYELLLVAYKKNENELEVMNGKCKDFLEDLLSLRKSINELESKRDLDLKTANDKLETVSTIKGYLEASNATLEAELKSCKYDGEILHTSKKELESKVATLESEIKSLNKDLEAHHSMNVNLSSSKLSTEEHLNTLLKAKSSLESSSVSLQAQLAAKNLELTTKNLEQDSLLAKLRCTEADLTESRKSLGDILVAKKDLDSKFAEQENSITSLSHGLEVISKLNSELEDFKLSAENKIKELESSKKELESKLAEHENSIKSLSNDLNSMRTRSVENEKGKLIAEDKVKELESSKKELESKLAEHENSMQVLSNGLEVVGKLNAELETSKLSTEGKLENAHKSNRELEDCIMSLKSQVNSKTVECDSLTATLGNTQAQLVEIQEKYEITLASKSSLEVNLQTSRSEYEALLSEKSKLESEYVSLDVKAKKFINDLVAVRREYSELESVKSAIDKSYSTALENISSQNMTIASLESELSNVRASYATVTASKSSIEVVLGSANQQNRNLKDELESIRQKHHELEVAKESTETKLTAALEKNSSLQNSIITLQSELNGYLTLQAFAASLESELEEKNIAIASTQREFGDVSMTKADLEAKVEALESSLQGKALEMEKIESTLEEKALEIGTLQNSMTELEAELAHVNEKARTFLHDLVTLRMSHSELETSKASLDEKLLVTRTKGVIMKWLRNNKKAAFDKWMECIKWHRRITKLFGVGPERMKIDTFNRWRQYVRSSRGHAFASVTASKESLEVTVKSLESEVLTIRNERDKFESDLKSLNESHNELLASKEYVDEGMATISNLKAEKSALADKMLESFKQVKTMTEKAAILESENDQLQKALNSITDSLETTKKALDESTISLTSTNARLENQNKKLLSDVLSAKSFFDDMEEFHKSREKELEEELIHVREVLETMTHQLKSANSATKYRELIMTSQPEINADKDVLITHIQSLQAEVEVLKDHITFLKSDKLKLNKELQLKEEEIEKLGKLLNDVSSSENQVKYILLKPDQYVSELSLQKEAEVDILDSIETSEDIWTDVIKVDELDLNLQNAFDTDGKLFILIQSLGLMYSYEEHGKVLLELSKSNSMKLTKDLFIDWYLRYIYSNS